MAAATMIPQPPSPLQQTNNAVKMSSGSEVQGCIELVTAAFHDAAITAGRLVKKLKTQNPGQSHSDTRQALLFQALNDASKKLQEAYDYGCDSFGAAYQLGDHEARQALLTVAVDLNMNVTTLLHAAVDHEGVQPDIVTLHEAAITYRHDAVRALKDLHYRLEIILPVSNFSRFSPDSSTDDLTKLSGPRKPRQYLAGAPVPSPDLKQGLRRLLSTGNPVTRRRARSIESKTRRRATAYTDDSQPLPLSFTPATPKPDSREPPSPIQQVDAPSPLVYERERPSVDLRRKSSANQLEKTVSNTSQSSRTHKPSQASISTISTTVSDKRHTGGVNLLMDEDRCVSPISEVEMSTISECADIYRMPFRPQVSDLQPRDWSPVVPPVPPPRRRPPITETPEIPPAPVGLGLTQQSLKLVTTPAFGHSGRANVISPIAEIDDNASVDGRDYDKESIYSQNEGSSADSLMDTPTSASTAPSSQVSNNSTPPKDDCDAQDFEPRSFYRTSMDSDLGDADRSRDASPSDLSGNDADLALPPRTIRKKKSFNSNPTRFSARSHLGQPNYFLEPTTYQPTGMKYEAGESRPAWHRREPTADSGYSSGEGVSSPSYDHNTIPIMNNVITPVRSSPSLLYPAAPSPATTPLKQIPAPLKTIDDIGVIRANAPPRPVTAIKRPQASPALLSSAMYEFPTTTFGAKANASALTVGTITSPTRPVPLQRMVSNASSVDSVGRTPSIEKSNNSSKAAMDKKNRWNLMRELREQKDLATGNAKATPATKAVKTKEREKANMHKHKAMQDLMGFS